MTTRTASVPATPVGKARSAASGMMNVKSQTVLAEVVALKAIANVSKASLGLFVKKVNKKKSQIRKKVKWPAKVVHIF